MKGNSELWHSLEKVCASFILHMKIVKETGRRICFTTASVAGNTAQ